jgi:hypothetical protein
MLKTLDGKPVNYVPHKKDFDALLKRLGYRSACDIRRYLDGIIDHLIPTNKGHRTFGSSQLGSDLTPWPDPLAELYWEARSFLGEDATEDDVQDRASLWFGLFVWERIVKSEKSWIVWDPNLNVTDPNREPLGKVYFEDENN